MNRYQFPVPQVAIGSAALAMTVVTLSIAIVLPATALPERSIPSTALATADRQIGADPVPRSLRIDVLGARDQSTALGHFRGIERGRRQPG